MSGHDLLIRGGHVVDPATGIDGLRDILVRDGLIARVGEGLDPDGAEVMDALGMIVLPGLIDMHVHLREPGFEESETIMTGCDAAAAGGFTAVCAMPNTDPPTDDAGRVRFILERSRGARARVYPVGTITRGREGRELAEMQDMADSGAVGFSDDGTGVADSRIMFNALRYASRTGRPVIAHEEDPDLARGGCMNESALSAKLGLPGIPRLAEELPVMRDIAIAEYTGTGIHITHISTRGTVELIRAAKARGVRVTCDVTPHHLTLDERNVATYDTRFKMNPPLRTADDIDALHGGLRDGTIDAIATDHAPHSLELKEQAFSEAANGVTGLETAVAVLHREYIIPGRLSWTDIARTMSLVPARILGIPGGTLEQGAVADITVYNPKSPWTVRPSGMKSRSGNTAWFDWDLPGRTGFTVVGGTVHHP